MRQVDWVDRLAGVRSLGKDTDSPFGVELTPEGPWLEWPKWRRLVDLARAKVLRCLMYRWYLMTWPEEARKYADLAIGMYDIRLWYRFRGD